MRLVDEARSRASEANLVPEFPRFRDWSIEIGLGKDISEPQLQLVQHVAARVKWHGTANRLRYRPKLVYAVAMVAVRMSDDDSVETADTGGKQLLAKVWATVDEQALVRAFNENGGS